ncbi:hypothetical protein L207DRAFT_528830 [Hyaloscypha variabilis F]|uniref:Uncharacterized protein n=1 Tax=Hyaloscypha variabilis (strain UAMH 11265 / GT02V1 / F) TaxID=1149755 RepID=A0A2J6RPP4_HYAVF|nr:hypothetical protein L207DRAFT_528830 [Hyaloscypha variabilis F]
MEGRILGQLDRAPRTKTSVENQSNMLVAFEKPNQFLYFVAIGVGDSFLSVSDTISLALGLVGIGLSVIANYVTRKQRDSHSRLFRSAGACAEFYDNKASDLDVENVPLQNLGRYIEAPHGVIDDFLLSLARVINYRRMIM